MIALCGKGVLVARAKFGRLSNWPTTCAANTLTAKEVWSCKRDEGRPLGAGDQAQASNHCELPARSERARSDGLGVTG